MLYVSINMQRQRLPRPSLFTISTRDGFSWSKITNVLAIFAEFFFDTTNCENTDGDAASDSCLGRGVILQTRSRRTGQG